MRRDNVVGHICICNALTFESLDPKKVHFCTAGSLHLRNVQVLKFVYQDHRVKNEKVSIGTA